MEMSLRVMESIKMKIAKSQLEQIIKEEIIKEAGGDIGSFGGVAGALGTKAGRKGQEIDSPDSDLQAPAQIAEDDFIGLLISLGNLLDTWVTQKYATPEIRYQSYFDDIQALVEEFDPCAHQGQQCGEAHPDQTHEECIEVTVNNELYEAKKKDCFNRKDFDSKSKCIEDEKNMPEKSADAYVAKVLRDKGEIK